jgi:hypothetical protein
MPFASALSFSAMTVPTVFFFGSLVCAFAVVITTSHFRVAVISRCRNKLSTFALPLRGLFPLAEWSLKIAV